MKKINLRQGFTLLELLVVIAIIALMVSVVLPNLLGARERAKDAQKKASFHEMKNALRMFYNDFQQYPASSAMLSTIRGCGSNNPPNADCAVGGCFFSGADTCSNPAATVYMKSLPVFNPPNRQDWRYYSSTPDTFCLSTPLANTADADLIASQNRCGPAGQNSCTVHQCPSTNYCVCED